MPAPTEQATPVQQDGSLEAASQRIQGLLSEKPEDKPSKEKPPEQAKAAPAEPSPEQAPAEPDAESDQDSDDEIEQAASTKAEEDTDVVAVQPRTLKISDDLEVTEEEAIKGYLRHADYTRKTQAVAEEKRQFEEKEAAAVRAQRQQYDELLGQLESTLKDIRPAEPDWTKLKTELPSDEFAARLLEWQQTSKHIENVQAERAKVKAQQDEDAKRGFRQYVELEHAKLADALPDLKDPEKAKTLKSGLVEYAKSKGFSEAELENVVDHRLVLLLHDAARYQQSLAKAPKIQNKIEKAMETSAPGSRTTPPKPDKLAAAKQRLAKTHSAEDAGKVIEHLI